jgi:hypothetical protein
VQDAQRTSQYLNGNASNSGFLVEERSIFDKKTQQFTGVISIGWLFWLQLIRAG